MSRSRTRFGAAALAAVSLSVFPACVGTAVVEHEIGIRLSDPSGRLGRAPWQVTVAAPTSVYDAGLEGAIHSSGGEARPDVTYVGRFSTQEGGLAGWRSRPRQLEVGLVVPALASEGWWRTVIVVFDDGSARGYARLCPWGDLLAEAEAEIVMLKGTARERGKGWRLDLALVVPPRRT